MNLTDILAKCDHTLLTQTATWEDIRAVCDDGMRYHTASVCIPACYVKQAKDYVDFLEQCIQHPITMASSGPKREEMTYRTSKL